MSEILSTAKESDEIVERLEYMVCILDTPPYNTSDEVTAIREAVKCVNEHDSLVAKLEKAEAEVALLRSMVDKMAYYINENDNDEDICSKVVDCLIAKKSSILDTTLGRCEDCIKKYFESEAKGE